MMQKRNRGQKATHEEWIWDEGMRECAGWKGCGARNVMYVYYVNCGRRRA